MTDEGRRQLEDLLDLRERENAAELVRMRVLLDRLRQEHDDASGVNDVLWPAMPLCEVVTNDPIIFDPAMLLEGRRQRAVRDGTLRQFEASMDLREGDFVALDGDGRVSRARAEPTDRVARRQAKRTKRRRSW